MLALSYSPSQIPHSMTQRILLYTDEPGVGGVAQYNHEILLALRQRGDSVICVQSPADTPLIREQQAIEVQHYWLSFDTMQEFGRTLTNADEARSIFKQFQPDLILFSDGCPISNFAAKQAAIALEIPFFVVVGFVTPDFAKTFDFCLPALAEHYAKAKAIVAVSQENLHLLHLHFRLPIDRGEVIYYGRPPTYFAPRDRVENLRLRESLGIPAAAIVCFTAARLEPIKGYQYQLGAIDQLQRDDVYFVWAGEGQLEAQLREAIDRQGENRIRLLGKRWDIANLLNIADIFVFPSEAEGMPLAVMEAMAKGIPTIATSVSGIPEELGETGKLLLDPNLDPQGTIDQLAQTIAAWADDSPLRQAIGQACRQRAIELFQADRMVRETLSVIDTILGALRDRALFPDGDYVSPGLAIVRPDAAFPNKIIGNPQTCPWPHLRRTIGHNWYVDRRQQQVGFLSRDEAHILYNSALQFRGKPALEIGCWLGWSACHLALAGVELDVIDPMLGRSEFYQSVDESLTAAGVRDRVNLVAGYSPQAVETLASEGRQWSLIFIDGDHDAPAPLQDAIACLPFATPDAMIVFHDLASPDVAAGLDYLKSQGWKTRIYQTMQIMGVAWRGNVEAIDHQPDPGVNWSLPVHLQDYETSSMEAGTRLFNSIQSELAIALRLRSINWIAFPDWNLPEDALFAMLSDLLHSVLTHGDRAQLALLISTSGIDAEEADLIISGVLIELVIELEINDAEPEITLLGELSAIEWQALLPKIDRRVMLPHEDKSAIDQSGIDRAEA